MPDHDGKPPASPPPRKLGPWLIHRTEVSYENPWIRVEANDITQPDGSSGLYGVVRMANLATGVLPIDADGFTWLVGQHRFPFDDYSWELPEGGGKRGVDPRLSAARELEEEAGLKAAAWALLGEWRLSNSVTDEVAYGYIAWDLSGGEAAPDAGEVLELRRVPFRDLVDACVSGEIDDAFTILMVFAAIEKARRGELPDAVSALIKPV